MYVWVGGLEEEETTKTIRYKNISKKRQKIPK
jgi:hypothetical protein